MITEAGLVKSRALLETDVEDSHGHKLAAMRELFIDPALGEVRFAILEARGVFGGDGKMHPVPWRLLRFDAARRTLICALDKDALRAAPAYDREQLNSTSYGWAQQAEHYFEAEPHSFQS